MEALLVTSLLSSLSTMTKATYRSRFIEAYGSRGSESLMVGRHGPRNRQLRICIFKPSMVQSRMETAAFQLLRPRP